MSWRRCNAATGGRSASMPCSWSPCSASRGSARAGWFASSPAFVDAQPELVAWRRGHCLSYGEAVAFWALGEVVKAQAGILESDDPREVAAKLDAAVRAVADDASEREWLKARLAPLVGLATDAEAPPSRDESFMAWRRFLDLVAAQRPLVLVIEDLHWADPALLDFLEQLARLGRRGRPAAWW